MYPICIDLDYTDIEKKIAYESIGKESAEHTHIQIPHTCLWLNQKYVSKALISLKYAYK